LGRLRVVGCFGSASSSLVFARLRSSSLVFARLRSSSLVFASSASLRAFGRLRCLRCLRSSAHLRSTLQPGPPASVHIGRPQFSSRLPLFLLRLRLRCLRRLHSSPRLRVFFWVCVFGVYACLRVFGRSFSPVFLKQCKQRDKKRWEETGRDRETRRETERDTKDRIAERMTFCAVHYCGPGRSCQQQRVRIYNCTKMG